MSTRCTCRTRRDRSRSEKNSPPSSPNRIPDVSPKTQRAWYRSDSAAAKKRFASSKLKGRISGGGTRGGDTSLQTLCSTRRHLTAWVKADDRTPCTRLTLAADSPASRLREYRRCTCSRFNSLSRKPPNAGRRCTLATSQQVSKLRRFIASLTASSYCVKNSATVRFVCRKTGACSFSDIALASF